MVQLAQEPVQPTAGEGQLAIGQFLARELQGQAGWIGGGGVSQQCALARSLIGGSGQRLPGCGLGQQQGLLQLALLGGVAEIGAHAVQRLLQAETRLPDNGHQGQVDDECQGDQGLHGLGSPLGDSGRNAGFAVGGPVMLGRGGVFPWLLDQ